MQFLRPKNLAETLKLVGRHPDYEILAGGTDICVRMNSGILKPAGLINIWGLSELKGIKEDGNFIEIGALATHSEIINSNLINKYLPALSDACMTIGAVQIQNRGTIGGNVMNASPAGDTLPVLLAYDADVETANKESKRSIKFSEFYKGYRKTALKNDEIVLKFRIKKTGPCEKSAFIKIGTRKAQAISKVMGCFVVAGPRAGQKIKSIAIAFGSVAPIPIRTPETEKFLTGKMLTEKVIQKAVDLVKKEVTPIDDIRSTAEYRRHIAGVLLKRFLESNIHRVAATSPIGHKTA